MSKVTIVRIFTLLGIFSILVPMAPTASAGTYLIAPSDPDNASFRGQVAGFLGSTVDYYDAESGTPTLAELSGYDAVFVWANRSFADSNAYGDVLADYVDAGGRVVLGAFTTYSSGNDLGGRIMSSGYSPVVSPGGGNYFALSDYAGDGTSSLWTGVSSYAAYFRDDVVLQGTGILDGTFIDGSIAGAYRPDGRVVYVGGMDTSEDGTSGDSARLLANALGSPLGTPSDDGGGDGAVPEPASIGLAGLGLLVIGFSSKRKKRA